MNKVMNTEKSNPASRDIDLMTSEQIARLINAEDQKVALAVQSQIKPIGQAIELIAQAFLQGGRLAYFGAGTSGRLGVLDASECWPTFGVGSDLVSAYIAGGDKALRYSVENAEDSAELGLQDLEKFKPSKKDVVVGISASGNPRYLLALLEKARMVECGTVAITSNPEAKIQNFADVFICTNVGPEVLTGSSRMKSGTAQKMVLNMLSTGAMIRIGKTYQNYMIDVHMMNEKLIDRGCRIVSEITGATYEQAKECLAKCHNVKTVCVMLKKGCTQEKAEELLWAQNGILRKVIS